MAAVSGVGQKWASNLCFRQESSSSFGKSRTNSHLIVKMAVSVDGKNKTYTLQKSEEAFNKAKVCFFSPF